MGMLKSVAVGAGLALALSGTHAESVQQPVGFEKDVPEKAFINAGMNVRSYNFAATTEESSGVMKQAMYDRQLGIACSWTLERVAGEFRMAVSNQACSKREEPEGWQRAASEEMNDSSSENVVGFGAEVDFYGDGSRIGQFTREASPDSPYVRHQARLWNNDTNQVCLASGLSVGPVVIARVDHGCFGMSRNEFVIKRAISSFGPSLET